MTPREQQLVRALADSVRVLSLEQIARTWWSDTRWGRSRAKGTLSALTDEGWLHMQRALSRPIVSLPAPLVRWQPESLRPDLAEVARILHRRSMTNAIPLTVVFASRRAVAMFGTGRAPTIKLTQMTHDVSVSEVYLQYRSTNSSEEQWLSEDRLPHDWPIKVRPDAVLRDSQGGIIRAVEYGGDYPPSRLVELHEGIASMGIGYEIW